MCVINYLFASLTQNNREQTADMLKKAERLIRDNLGLN
jgi:hypothetical protein